MTETSVLTGRGRAGPLVQTGYMDNSMNRDLQAERFARAARIQPGVDSDAALVESTAVETQAQFRTSVPLAHAPRAPHR